MSINLTVKSLLFIFPFFVLPVLSCSKPEKNILLTERPEKLLSSTTGEPIMVSVHSVDGFIDVLWSGGEPPFNVTVKTPFGTDIFETYDFSWSTMKPLIVGDVVSASVKDAQGVSGSGSATNVNSSSGNEPLPEMDVDISSNDLYITFNISWINDPNSSGPFCSDNIVFNAFVENGDIVHTAEETAPCNAGSKTITLPKIWYNDTVYLGINKTPFYGCNDAGIGYYFIIPNTFYSDVQHLQAHTCNYHDIFP